MNKAYLLVYFFNLIKFVFPQAPLTGLYTFYLAGDDQCELWISSNAAEVNAKRILAFKPNQWTNPNQWNK